MTIESQIFFRENPKIANLFSLKFNNHFSAFYFKKLLSPVSVKVHDTSRVQKYYQQYVFVVCRALFLGLGTDLHLEPNIFLMVPPTPFFLIASVALSLSFLWKLKHFLGLSAAFLGFSCFRFVLLRSLSFCLCI